MAVSRLDWPPVVDAARAIVESYAEPVTTLRQFFLPPGRHRHDP